MNNRQDGFWQLIVRKGQVLIPTMARTEAGFYLAVEPIVVVDSRNFDAVAAAFLDAIHRGNPIVPTPSRDNYPPSLLLKYSNAKSLPAFEKSAQRWKLGRYSAEYAVVPYRPGRNGGSEEDVGSRETFSIAEPIESVVGRLIERALGGSSSAERRVTS
jgi:hypothetical protein